MTETLTQKSQRIGNARSAIALLKAAIVKACHVNRWKGGRFESFKSYDSDVDIDLEWLGKSWAINEAERAIFHDTRLKVADLRAYLEGRPTNLSNVDDIGWVKRLNSVLRTKSDKIRKQGRCRLCRRVGLVQSQSQAKETRMASNVKKCMVVQVARRRNDVGETASDGVDESYTQMLLRNE